MAKKKNTEEKVETNEKIKVETKNEVKDEVKAEVKDTTHEVEIKKEKKKRIWDEIKSFFILALIVVLIVFGGWYWYTHIYKEAKNDKTPEEAVKEYKGYKAYSYDAAEGNYLAILNNKYVLEYNGDNVLKVLDMDLKTLYEGEESYDGWFVSSDGKLYFYEESDEGDVNYISLYRLEDEKITLVKEIGNNAYYSKIYSRTSNSEGVIGYVGVFNGYTDENERIHTEYVYLLNGKEYELTNLYLDSDESRLSVDSEFVLYDSKYMIYHDEENKYGVYDIVNNKEVIAPTYEKLYRGHFENFVAYKDGKAGIIDLNLKKLVDFEYDFIDVSEANYVVGKDNKLAVMFSDHIFLTDFIFDYQDRNGLGYLYNECCGNVNSFELYNVANKFLLITNVGEINGINYNKHEAYLISDDGTYETITENGMNIDSTNKIIWIYNSDEHTYTFYDLDFNELYTLDFSSYDNNESIRLSIWYGTIIANNRGKELYYDLKTGEQLDKINDYVEYMDNVMYSFDANSNIVTVSENEETLIDYNFNPDDIYNLYVRISNTKLAYYDSKKIVILKKGE